VFFAVSAVRREFVQLHAMIGCKTNVVRAAEATVGPSGDAPNLPPLVDATLPHFDVQQVAADKAYGSVTNLEMLDARGVEALIPFKSNSTATSKNNRSEVWSRVFHFFSLSRDEFLAACHTRSNVESTFSAMKRKFSDQIRSKTPTAQINEALLKVLCQNLVCLVKYTNPLSPAPFRNAPKQVHFRRLNDDSS
jgi:hypothetical protein